MLLGPNDEVLLSDFGLVLIDQSTISQAMQTSAGTPSYMAPEQFLGKPRQASDQYALGVVVYEWLCGQLPFSKGEMGYLHNYVQPPSLREKVPAISPAVEKVVLKALEKEPHQRFTRVIDFAQALEEAYILEPYVLPPVHSGLTASPFATQLAVLSALPEVEEEDDTLPAPISARFRANKPSIQPVDEENIPTTPLVEKASSHPSSTPSTIASVSPQVQPKHKTSRRNIMGWLIASGIIVAIGGGGAVAMLLERALVGSSNAASGSKTPTPSNGLSTTAHTATTAPQHRLLRRHLLLHLYLLENLCSPIGLVKAT